MLALSGRSRGLALVRFADVAVHVPEPRFGRTFWFLPGNRGRL
jgi:hypothetical protein